MTAGTSIPFTKLGKGDGTGAVMLVPGADAPLIALELPSGLRGQAREQVARRMVLDQLGLNETDLEIRLFSQNGAPGSGVLIASRDQLAAWKHDIPAGCKAVLPDYLALPTAEHVWTVDRNDNGGWSVRLGPFDGFSAEPDLAEAMMVRALASTPPKALVDLIGLPDRLKGQFEAVECLIVSDAVGLAPQGLGPLQVLSHGELSLDLRSDPRAARAQLRRRVLPWRWPLLAAVLAGGVYAAAHLLAIQSLDAETKVVRTEITSAVRNYFLPTGPILDVRSQVSRKVEDSRRAAAAWQAEIRPLDILQSAAQVIAIEQGQPELLSYTSTEGLVAEVRVTDFAAVSRLTGALRASGLTVDVVGSRAGEGEGGVLTELRIGQAADGVGQ